MMILRWRDPNPDHPLPIQFEQRAALDLPWSAGPTIIAPTLEQGDTYRAESGIVWCAEMRARTFREEWSAHSNVIVVNCEEIPPTFVPEPQLVLSLAIGIVALAVLCWIRERRRVDG